MMKKSSVAMLVVSVILLSGCKLEWSSDVLYSKLFDKNITVTTSTILAEVAACNSYEDSRKPSDSLLQVQSAIADVFPDSKFDECFTKHFNSYAKFTLPIAYGPAELLTAEHPKLRVLSYKNEAVLVNISHTLEERLKKYQNNKFSTTDFNPSDVSIVINIKNDTGSDKKINVQGAYLNGFPVINQRDIIFKKDESFNFRLSNVTAETMFLPSKLNQPAFFMSIAGEK